MNSSRFKLNITLNRAGFLLIIIYISDVRRRTAGVAAHFDEMSAYHASPARPVENVTKDEAWSIFHRAVNNRAIRSFPTRRPIPYTTWNASTRSVRSLVFKNHQYHSYTTPAASQKNGQWRAKWWPYFATARWNFPKPSAWYIAIDVLMRTAWSVRLRYDHGLGNSRRWHRHDERGENPVVSCQSRGYFRKNRYDFYVGIQSQNGQLKM